MTEAAGPWQRLVLPGGMLDGGEGRRSARDWIVDATLFVLSVGIGALSLNTTWAHHGTGARVADIVVGTFACLLLWLRRTRPVGVAVFTITASWFFAFAGGAALVAVFNAAIRAPRRELIWIVVAGLAGNAVFSSLYRGESSYDWAGLVFGVLLTVVVVGWGLFVRAQRDLMHHYRERAAQLESEQRLRVREAREAERRRIAREMHDVLAHRLSLLSVHAGALEFRPDAPADEVSHAAGVIRATAHTALEELRDVIGVLRDDGDEGTPEPPQPTFAEIPALIEESRAAGMNVSLRLQAPEDEEIPAALGRTAYRVVQEGLTNARKHAPSAAVDVAISVDGESSLVVEVVSRPAVGVATTRFTGAGAGTGLVGLSERVALAGGRLEYGPNGAGDFVLRASLPRSA
jgi:signal transduction histidine kinase